MDSSTETKKTGLYDRHVALGAKIVPFAGYYMPIQYSGIIDEHMTVRQHVGMFDVSHMGEFEIRGADAEKFLNKMTTNNVARLDPGNIQYSAMLYDDGGVVDDLLVYRFEDHYMAVVNAANLQKDFDWLAEHIFGDVQLRDVSDETALLAIQGPKAEQIVAELSDVPVEDITYYKFKLGKVAGQDCIISRTGYTGEDGFELYVKSTIASEVWDAVMEAGKPHGIKPIGLGARDSLRLEVAYCLYGNDIDKTTNPIEAGLGWIVKSKKKGGFIGKQPVLDKKTELTRKLTGFILNGKGIARHGCEVYHNGEKVGYVTSGGLSPVLNKIVGLAYIDLPFNKVGTEIEIDVRGRRLAAELVAIPFYNRENS